MKSSGDSDGYKNEKSPSQGSFLCLYVKEEVHYVAVLNDVFLTFRRKLAGGAAGSLRLQGHEVIVFDNLCADKASFEVRMDGSCGARGLVALADGPGAAFVCAGRKEGLKAKQAVSTLNQAGYAGLFKAKLVQKHLTVFVILYFCYV